ncbi:MAG: right-handed parallel beta-helix repeat-containing protein [Candidatus Thiodiazotropha sp.]
MDQASIRSWGGRLLLLALCGCSAGSLRDVTLPAPPVVREPVQVATAGAPREIIVDLQLTVARCDDYDPGARRCGAGDRMAFRELNQAAAAALPGDRVQVRGGVIRQQFAPGVSGIEGHPIRFTPYAEEQVIFRDIDQPAWLLKGVNHLLLEGFRLEQVLGWARLENAHYNLIRNNRFHEALARGTTGGFKLVESHYNRVEGNRFERGNDSLVLQASDRNLIADNSFEWGRHSLISVRCGNYNVIRGNRFNNERQKAMEIYDCEGTSDAPFRLDATKRNLIEGNRFDHVRGSSRPHNYNAIQYAGQLGIVRHNLFRDCLGGGINLQVYSSEALYNYGHRIYNNTFYANHCFALIDTARGGARIGENDFLNNLFYKNRDCRGGERQVELMWQDLDRRSNALADSDPGFVDESAGDLSLKARSPLVDAGVFLTRTTAAGTGSALPVEDAAFFFDGAGVPGVVGDEIRLEGEGAVARILEIDFAQGRLLLDRDLSWRQGQGVSLRYSGGAPDMGAYERSMP